ncbi:hypothetical protein A1507_21345 [Methylomonas koyamae]|uniref:Uncharacterized protein n=1 Tax=Methylomonas koyamae TaxID=702114 RepID=A0A177MZM0_9GAMM|nr:hypothetical protein A1507_21345 [Methylomonas koyamae]
MRPLIGGGIVKTYGLNRAAMSGSGENYDTKDSVGKIRTANWLGISPARQRLLPSARARRQLSSRYKNGKPIETVSGPAKIVV